MDPDKKMSVYKIWAPDKSLWSEWAKPVLFASASSNEMLADTATMDLPQVNWLTNRNYNTMIIVDLPGKLGVEEGLGLAALGYQPVPLYNGVAGPMNTPMLVDVKEIVEALFSAAGVLRNLPVSDSAPPAFLLDSNRMNVAMRIPGYYDNRWCIFPQDMPSADFLLKRRIQEVIVRADRIQDDLAHILCRYQERNIRISICESSETVGITVPTPSRFKSLFYRCAVILGLTRNAAGGFGGLVPMPSSGGG